MTNIDKIYSFICVVILSECQMSNVYCLNQKTLYVLRSGLDSLRSSNQNTKTWHSVFIPAFQISIQSFESLMWIWANRRGCFFLSDCSTLLHSFLFASSSVNCSFYCWHNFHWAAIALDRSDCKAGCIAATCFSWSSVMNTIPVAIRHLEHTVTLLFIHIRLLISTVPWSPLEDRVIPRNLLLSVVTHLTELCTEIETTLKPSSRKSCWWFGQPSVWLSGTATTNMIDISAIRSTFQLKWDVSFILQSKVVDGIPLFMRFLF